MCNRDWSIQGQNAYMPSEEEFAEMRRLRESDEGKKMIEEMKEEKRKKREKELLQIKLNTAFLKNPNFTSTFSFGKSLKTAKMLFVTKKNRIFSPGKSMKEAKTLLMEEEKMLNKDSRKN